MKKILVLCTGNSCRSIMAEALINHYVSDVYQAYSAGSNPVGYVHPEALATLRRHNIPFTHPKSQSWDAFSDVSFDVLISVCHQAANEVCPVYLRACERWDWGVEDPAKAQGSEQEVTYAFEAAFLQFQSKIQKTLMGSIE